MEIFTSIWDGLKGGLEAILRVYEGLLEPIAGQYAWGLGIILLTLTVRLFLVPLAVRQTKSMRNMQAIQPELKKIQKKYAADRGMMKTDPERYKAMKEKQREAQMALYQEHGVNPVGGCLPLILQMPIFFALFSILRPDGDGVEQIAELAGAPFVGIDSLTSTAASGAGIGAIVLVALQVGTTYYSTKQMQGRNTQAAAEQQQAQKLMLYIMPVFLGYLSWTFPIGVVLYWVTTNVWTIGQQAVIFRSAEAAEEKMAEERAAARDAARARRRSKTDDSSGGSAKGKGTSSPSGKKTGGSASSRAKDTGASSKAGGEKNGRANRSRARSSDPTESRSSQSEGRGATSSDSTSGAGKRGEGRAGQGKTGQRRTETSTSSRSKADRAKARRAKAEQIRSEQARSEQARSEQARSEQARSERAQVSGADVKANGRKAAVNGSTNGAPTGREAATGDSSGSDRAETDADGSGSSGRRSRR